METISFKTQKEKNFEIEFSFLFESIQNKVNVDNSRFMTFLKYHFKKAWKLFKNKSHPLLLRLSSLIQNSKR